MLGDVNQMLENMKNSQIYGEVEAKESLCQISPCDEASKHENHFVPILYISESYTLMTIQNYGMLSGLASPSNLSTLTLMAER